MRLSLLAALFLTAGLVLALAHAASPTNGWRSLLGASYLIHGGTLADRQVASPNDRKISIVVAGNPAKEVFDSIGPDLPNTCSGEQGDRARNKKGVSCSFTKKDMGTKEGPYRCWIGVNLLTGESTATVSC